MKFPLRTEELTDLLPHRRPMVWVDRIIHVSDQRGSTEVTVCHKLMQERGRVHVGALVEFLAQSYGFIMAVQAIQHKRRLKVAQLAAIDGFDLLSQPLPCEGETLSAELYTVRELRPLYLVKGQVFAPQRRRLCTIKFKGYALFEGDEADFTGLQAGVGL